jgi:hypothetical protein
MLQTRRESSAQRDCDGDHSPAPPGGFLKADMYYCCGEAQSETQGEVQGTVHTSGRIFYAADP